LVALSGWLLLAWFSHQPPARLVCWLLGVLAVQWVLAVFVGLRASPDSRRHWLGWGIAFRVVGLFARPILDDDYYRFIWDGRMFALTGNPYATAPDAHFADAALPAVFAGVLDHVNYPDVPTIYGPITQFGFLISHFIAPAALWPWKLLLLGADVALLTMLQRLAPSESAAARASAFAAWCPLGIFETAFNAHPDALAVSLMTAALLARQSHRDAWLGLCCGLAVGARLFALLMVPFLLWRERRTAWISFSATLLACYAPFWLQGSTADLAGLLAFGREWEFNSSAYGLIAWGLGSQRARPLAALLFIVGWTGLLFLWARRGDARPAMSPGLLVFGLFFLFSPTFNPWYALWLLPFVALRPAPTGVAVLAAVSLSYLTRQNVGEVVLDGFAHPAWVRPVEFGLMAAAWVVQVCQRHHTKLITECELSARKGGPTALEDAGSGFRARSKYRGA